MAWVYVDTSAMVKRYVDEPGHREVRALLGRHEVVTSAVLAVELRGAFRRRIGDGTIERRSAAAVWTRFAADRTAVVIVAPTSEVLAAAETLVAEHPLRALDAVHVASARLFAARLGGEAVTFVTADRRQAAVAAAIGLGTAVVG